jgi:dephospho-CoA kinase
MIFLLFQELLIELFLTLPLFSIISQCEKRFLVHCKQPMAYGKIYRIMSGLLLFLSIHKCLPRTTIKTEDHEIIRIVFYLLRNGFIIMGIHLGQAFCPVAITGSIATGKSTVVESFLKMNVDSLSKNSTIYKGSNMKKRKLFRIIDADKIGHDILLSPTQLSKESSSHIDNRLVHPNDSIYTKILNTFGDKQIDNKNILNESNEIDRRKLGDIIFQDRAKRQMLNRITHPQIIRILVQQLFIGTYLRKELWIFADVPLLYESSYLRYLFSCIIVVACSADRQYERLRKRNPDLTETQCRQRIASQIPIDQKVAQADIVIWNNGTYDELSTAIQQALNELQRRMQYGQLSWLQYYILILVVGFLSYPIVTEYVH